MEIVYKKIEEIKPYINNPRNNENTISVVADCIRKVGFRVPIIIDENNVIICGHSRFAAAKNLEMKEIPCIIADDLTPKQVRSYRIIDNRTSQFSTWNFDLLIKELDKIKNIDISIYDFGSILTQDEENDIDKFMNKCGTKQLLLPEKDTDETNYTLSFPGKSIAMTKSEVLDLLKTINEYVEKEQTVFGFTNYILRNFDDNGKIRNN